MAGLPFIDGIAPERPALWDDTSTEWLTYGMLRDQAALWAARLTGPRGLVLLYAGNDRHSVSALIGALHAGHPVALFDPNLAADSRAELEATYRPMWIIGPEPNAIDHPNGRSSLHPDLAVLLSTSGSTGSAKLVRLTLDAMRSNAVGISAVLHIAGDEVGAGYLPLHYSYGLSVLTSHLTSGARVRLTNMSLTDREFWPAMRRAQITHMPGVPFHYQIMLKLGLERLNVPSIRVMTQAGGSLATELRQQAHAYMEKTSGQFFVLYGQTEAAPRMTTLQHQDFLTAPSSVGHPLPECRIEIREPDIDGHGEVVFHGPNVMMGYAESHHDLAKGDELQGTLMTGDIGRLDDAGRLTLSGRAKRMGKLYGLRINLDEVEMLINRFGSVAVTQTGDTLTVHVATTGDSGTDQALLKSIHSFLESRLTVPTTSYRFRVVPIIPRTERGKVNYPALEIEQ